MRFNAGLTAALVAVVMGLAGCVSTVPVDYSPSSTLSATGAVQVADFKYLPAINGKVKPNQLRNTAIGAILLDKNIDVFFHNAVFTELRFVGVKVADNNLKLSGEINEFLVDDLGYSVDWTVDVHYVITNSATGAVVYDSDKITKNRTAKFANAFVALNQQIKQNIEDLIKDPAFIKAIN
jgi:hypothetical protein